MGAPRGALLLDLDGTLCDSRPGIVRSIRHALERLGRPLEADADLDWCVGPPLQDSLARLLGGTQLVPEALALYRRRYEDVGLYENAVYPGIPAALDALRPRWDLFVATSKPEPFALEIVRHFGLEERFRRVYGSGLDGARSAKADLLRWILEREGRVAAAAVMVGDREHDMAGAAANGMAGVGVLWGYGREGDLRAAGAGWIVASPGDLSALLAEGRPAGS